MLCTNFVHRAMCCCKNRNRRRYIIVVIDHKTVWWNRKQKFSNLFRREKAFLSFFSRVLAPVLECVLPIKCMKSGLCKSVLPASKWEVLAKQNLIQSNVLHCPPAKAQVQWITHRHLAWVADSKGRITPEHGGYSLSYRLLWFWTWIFSLF